MCKASCEPISSDLNAITHPYYQEKKTTKGPVLEWTAASSWVVLLIVTFVTWNSTEAFSGLKKTVKQLQPMNGVVSYLSRRKLSPHSVFMMRNHLHNLFYVQHVPQSRMLPFKESNLLLQQIFIEHLLRARY